MRRRLAAATAGAVLIAAAVLVFSLAKHPIVVGTNTAAPLLPSLSVHRGETRCQAAARLPSGADRARVVVSSIAGPPGELRIRLSGPHARPISGAERVGLGGRVIRLDGTTRASHPARICLHYSGRGNIVLAGERKRVRNERALATPRKRGVASVVFLRTGQASWASRRDLIADRYANSQASPFGRWSLWVAIGAAIGAGLLALWWVVFRVEPRRGPS